MRPVTHLLRGLVFAYRGLLSPIMPGSCRFRPTCSRYALDAIGRYGALRGGRLAATRLARCHPWGGWGYDPVPEPDATGQPTGAHRASAGSRKPLPR